MPPKGTKDTGLAPTELLASRTIWYTILRLLLATGLFGLATWVVWNDPTRIDDRQVFFSLVVLSYAILGTSLGIQPRIKRLSDFVAVQLIFDAFLITALVYMTGGPSSIFVVLYFTNIVAAAYLGYGRITLATAGLDASTFVLMAVLSNEGVLPISTGSVTRVEAWSNLALQVLGFLVVGLLTARLASRLQRTDAALAAQIETTRALEEIHGLILQSVRSGILTVGPDGIVRGSNPAARECLKEPEGRPIDLVLTGLRQTRERQEVLVSGPTGFRTLLCHRTPIGSQGSEVVLFEDVTELRLMQAESEREERLVGVGKIAAAIAHEIRNPLASLSGAIQLMRDETPGPLMDIVLREIHRLNDLVGDFLEVARAPRVYYRPTVVQEVIQEVLTNFRRDPRYGEQVHVRTLGDAEAPFMLDPDRLKQILWNLLLNAAQAMPDGGEVEIQFRRAMDGLHIQVRDHGPGIPLEEQEKLFDPFHTTRRGGTGLGLVTVQRLVKAHAGTIEVRPATPNGTAFVLFFPERTLPGEDVVLDPRGHP